MSINTRSRSTNCLAVSSYLAGMILLYTSQASRLDATTNPSDEEPWSLTAEAPGLNEGSAEYNSQEIQYKNVQQYYEELQSSANLKTSACCAAGSPPAYLRTILSKIDDTVLSSFYGCGFPVPPAVEGLRVLDLGSGSGRDVYLFSALVGEKGKVIGVDMTKKQVEIARSVQESQRQKFGLSQSNVEFIHGRIEDLDELGIADQSIDLVVSNCVLNLSPEKHRIFSEIKRVLKPGGELYFSDVYVDRRLDPNLQSDYELLGECLSGAMYTEDFRRMMESLGFRDLRIINKSEIEITNQDLKDKLGEAKFYSISYRIFRLDLEDRCEDYGQIACYKGSIKECPDTFTLDNGHQFIRGSAVAVCGNTADMLQRSRYGEHFIVNDRRDHKGLFLCNGDSQQTEAECQTGSCCL